MGVSVIPGLTVKNGCDLAEVEEIQLTTRTYFALIDEQNLIASQVESEFFKLSVAIIGIPDVSHLINAVAGKNKQIDFLRFNRGQGIAAHKKARILPDQRSARGNNGNMVFLFEFATNSKTICNDGKRNIGELLR